MTNVMQIRAGFSDRANPFVHTETFGFDGLTFELKSFHDANGVYGNMILTCLDNEHVNDSLQPMSDEIHEQIMAGSTFDDLITTSSYDIMTRTEDVLGHTRIKTARDFRDAVLQILRMRYEMPSLTEIPLLKAGQVGPSLDKIQ